MDRGIARVLEALDAHGLADNTLVLFSSDNGPQFGGPGDMCTDRFNCGFAGAKTLVYEGGIRLPMVLRWPAGLPAPRTLAAMVHFTDWLPTLLAVAGSAPPRDLRLDGVDVLPVLRGERGQVLRAALLAMEPLHAGGRMQRRHARRPLETRSPRHRRAHGRLAGRSRHGHRRQVPPGKVFRGSPRDAGTACGRPLACPRSSSIWRPIPRNATTAPAEQPDRVARMERALSRWFEEVERERRAIAD